MARNVMWRELAPTGPAPHKNLHNLYNLRWAAGTRTNLHELFLLHTNLETSLAHLWHETIHIQCVGSVEASRVGGGEVRV